MIDSLVIGLTDGAEETVGDSVITASPFTTTVAKFDTVLMLFTVMTKFLPAPS